MLKQGFLRQLLHCLESERICLAFSAAASVLPCSQPGKRLQFRHIYILDQFFLNDIDEGKSDDKQ